jgi:5-methylcytosine-specific restriction protein A
VRVCSVPGCPVIHDRNTSRCEQHDTAARQKHWDATAGYNTAGHRKRFRPGVLARDPVCVICHIAQSTVADHYPLSRRDLLDQGMDADDPEHGRGLCKTCHDKSTAEHQPGGWNAR